MVERKSFSFFISYWEAIEELPENQQLPVLKAIIKYAFFDEEPTQFKGIKRAVFLLVKPTLDNSKKKSANGKQGGSKPKANRKQIPSDISEGKGEGKGVGIGVGIGEGEGKNIPLSDDSLFTAFWNAYPEHALSEREEAWEAWKKLNPTPDKAAEIMACLEAWKAHKRWTDDDGAFVPAPKNFLKPEKLYMSSRPPSGKQASASGGDRKLDGDEIAAIKRMMSEMEETET